MTASNVHLIEDENLGGLLREYVESDRKADVGDYVVIVNAKKTERDRCPFDDGHISTVISTSDDSVKIKPFAKIYDYEYRTLDPTDIVHVDEDGNGRRYKLVDRQAEVGEKVVVIDDACDQYDFGGIYTVEESDKYARIPSKNGGTVFIRREEYRVLEPVASEQAEIVTVDESQASPSVVDMLGNLAVRINELERQIDVLKKRQVLDNIQTLKRGHDRLSEEIDTLHSNQKRMAEEMANVKTGTDWEIVVAELAKLLARESRRGLRI